MTKDSQKAAVAKYLSKMADIRLHVKKGLKEDIKKAADKRNMSVTAFIISCVNPVLFDDFLKEPIKKTTRKRRTTISRKAVRVAYSASIQ
mgnify:CR=1 FL=1